MPDTIILPPDSAREDLRVEGPSLLAQMTKHDRDLAMLALIGELAGRLDTVERLLAPIADLAIRESSG